mmetsp:Transcript_6312/g.25598  ORF Transcript_6312/g.25598 Transcript_6312/m.25598 type:complete len:470 (+) Transcript_6312:1755-3164(+)
MRGGIGSEAELMGGLPQSAIGAEHEEVAPAARSQRLVGRCPRQIAQVDREQIVGQRRRSHARIEGRRELLAGKQLALARADVDPALRIHAQHGHHENQRHQQPQQSPHPGRLEVSRLRRDDEGPACQGVQHQRVHGDEHQHRRDEVVFPAQAVAERRQRHVQQQRQAAVAQQSVAQPLPAVARALRPDEAPPQHQQRHRQAESTETSQLADRGQILRHHDQVHAAVHRHVGRPVGLPVNAGLVQFVLDQRRPHQHRTDTEAQQDEGEALQAHPVDALPGHAIGGGQSQRQAHRHKDQHALGQQGRGQTRAGCGHGHAHRGDSPCLGPRSADGAHRREQRPEIADPVWPQLPKALALHLPQGPGPQQSNCHGQGQQRRQVQHQLAPMALQAGHQQRNATHEVQQHQPFGEAIELATVFHASKVPQLGQQHVRQQRMVLNEVAVGPLAALHGKHHRQVLGLVVRQQQVMPV